MKKKKSHLKTASVKQGKVNKKLGKAIKRAVGLVSNSLTKKGRGIGIKDGIKPAPPGRA